MHLYVGVELSEDGISSEIQKSTCIGKTALKLGGVEEIQLSSRSLNCNAKT